MIFDDKANELVTSRLINWGLAHRGKIVNLDFPTWYEIWKSYLPNHDHRITPDLIDAAHIENILTSLNLGALKGVGLGDLYLMVCKQEYIEADRPRELKAEYVRRAMRLPCSERTFRYHLHNAKRAVHTFANPL
jgi:hypothetical protein